MNKVLKKFKNQTFLQGVKVGFYSPTSLFVEPKVDEDVSLEKIKIKKHIVSRSFGKVSVRLKRNIDVVMKESA